MALNTRAKHRVWKEEWVNEELELRAYKPVGKEHSSYFIKGSQVGCLTQLAGIMHQLIKHKIISIGNLQEIVDAVEEQMKQEGTED